MWQAVSTRGEVLDLGTDFVYYLRNSDIKSTLLLRQETLRNHGEDLFIFISFSQLIGPSRSCTDSSCIQLQVAEANSDHGLWHFIISF